MQFNTINDTTYSDDAIPIEGANKKGLSTCWNEADAEYPINNKGIKIAADDVVRYILSKAESLRII